MNLQRKNELARCFHGQEKYAVVVSDLTYVRVNYRWNYVCVLIDLYNREIIGFSAAPTRMLRLSTTHLRRSRAI